MLGAFLVCALFNQERIMQQVLRYSIKHQKHYTAKVYSKVIHDEWLKKNGKDK